MWKELDKFRREMENMIHGLSELQVSESPFANWARDAFYPHMRVFQEDNAVKVEAVIPGVDPNSLALSLEENTLIISGDKPRWTGTKQTETNGDSHEGVPREERPENSFKRSIELPAKVDADQTTAEYVHGVLRITMPKVEAAKARKIEVAVG
jgi:HSP20 family protein